MFWLAKRVRADDGVDPARGIEAERMSWSNLGPGEYRLALVDVAGKIIASVDLNRADLHDTRRAIGAVLEIKGARPPRMR